MVDRIGELPIRALVSSPLLRCRRTLEPLAGQLGLRAASSTIGSPRSTTASGRAARLSDLFSTSRCGRSSSTNPARRCSPAGRDWPRCSPAPFPPSANTTGRFAEDHGGRRRSGWPARTATSSSRSSPTRSASTSTAFQRITAEPASMSVIRYTPRCARSSCTSTTPGADLTAALTRPRRRAVIRRQRLR